MNCHLSTNFVWPVLSLLKQMSRYIVEEVFDNPCETFLGSLLLPDLIFEKVADTYDRCIMESKNLGRRRSKEFLFSIRM